MNAPERNLPLSRRGLLKAGGALIVGFSFAGGAGMAAPAGHARGEVAGPPDPNAIDTWIAIHADNTATFYFGKCELGQGNTTGLLQIAGEELDLDMSQLSSVRLDTNVTPEQGATSSSSSIERGGPLVRAAAAEARLALLQKASQRLGVQIGSLVVARGVVSIDGEPNRSVSYGELVGDKPFVTWLPIPAALIDELTKVFNLREREHDPHLCSLRLWRWSRSTAWRCVKQVMKCAALFGSAAMPKGLRHTFGVAGFQTVPPHIVQRWLGHASLRTTAIYGDVSGREERLLAKRIWDSW
jgi:hypothetical protein